MTKLRVGKLYIVKTSDLLGTMEVGVVAHRGEVVMCVKRATKTEPGLLLHKDGLAEFHYNSEIARHPGEWFKEQ